MPGKARTNRKTGRKLAKHQESLMKTWKYFGKPEKL